MSSALSYIKDIPVSDYSFLLHLMNLACLYSWGGEPPFPKFILLHISAYLYWTNSCLVVTTRLPFCLTQHKLAAPCISFLLGTPAFCSNVSVTTPSSSTSPSPSSVYHSACLLPGLSLAFNRHNRYYNLLFTSVSYSSFFPAGGHTSAFLPSFLAF